IAGARHVARDRARRVARVALGRPRHERRDARALAELVGPDRVAARPGALAAVASAARAGEAAVVADLGVEVTVDGRLLRIAGAALLGVSALRAGVCADGARIGEARIAAAADAAHVRASEDDEAAHEHEGEADGLRSVGHARRGVATFGPQDERRDHGPLIELAARSGLRWVRGSEMFSYGQS